MESMMHERHSHRIYVSAATGRLGPKGRGPTYCYWVDMRCERSGGENWQGIVDMLLTVHIWVSNDFPQGGLNLFYF
jgi:hypothetical protein